MPFEEGNNKGVKFGEGQDPTNGGRPKKLYHALKEMGYSKDDVRTAISELAWYSKQEIIEFIKDDSKPAILLVIAMAFEKAMKKGDYGFIKELIEQMIGKAKNSLDVTSEGEKVNIPIIEWIPKKEPH